MFTYFKDEKNIVYAYDETQTPQEGLVQITEQEKDELQRQKREAAFNVLSYIEKRRSAYPPITDYIDGVVKNDKVQIDKYIEECMAVKAKYPKLV
jgi:hypothetical protein